MIARINTGKTPSGAVYYNEDKVAHGEARFLGGYNAIALERALVTVGQKVRELENYAGMNRRISKPTFHTSLAFHPSEQLSDEKLTEISQQYMERLGYGDQPYLVYRHEDTNHPHIHIVSVSVDAYGKRITDSHQHRRSNTIRQALEKEHGLVEAEKQGKAVLMDGLLPEQILSYKEPEAKKAIGNVVQTAMKDYRFSGIDTFSAFLHQHRVQLNQLSGVGGDGKPYRGINFQLTDGSTDKRGQAIGPAIKASRFAFAPTMERLEHRFRQSRNQSKVGQDATRRRIDSALTGFNKISEADFKAQLRSEGVQVLDDGNRFIYVDHKSRNVYDELELGEQFRREFAKKGFVAQSERFVVKSVQQVPVRQAPASTKDTSPATTTVEAIGKVPTKKTRPVAKKGPVDGTTSSPGPKPAAEKSVTNQAPAQAGPVQLAGSPGVQPPTRPRVRTAEEEKALRRQVSQAYQTVRTEGLSGQPAPYFESQLIARFPTEYLTNQLTNQGVDVDDARQAVTAFETYKQGQLVDIRAKEQSYFGQTSDLLVKLAQQMPLDASSKQAFLASMELSLGGFNMHHRQDDDLRYPLNLRQQIDLRSGGGQAVAFPQKASKHQRSLYLAVAGGQPAPASVSYYQVSAYHLRTSLGEETFQRVAPSLNANYLTQVKAYLNERTTGSSLLVQLASRGIIVAKGADGKLRGGHVLSQENTFAELDVNLAKRLLAETIPPLSVQRSAQQTPAVRQLVSLSQAIDQRDESRIRQLTSVPGNKPEPLATGPAQVVSGLQATLIRLYTAPTPKQNTDPSAVVTQQTTPKINVPVSFYGKAVVAMLLKTELSPAQRGQVATQLGLQWQMDRAGKVHLIEPSATPARQAIYTLSAAEQQHISPHTQSPSDLPAKGTFVLGDTDRLLIAHRLNGKPLSELILSTTQIARLRINNVITVLGPDEQRSLLTWYNRERGNHILSQRLAQGGLAGSARRQLTDLYQRGFVVQKVLNEAGKPHYRMGLIGAGVATYATLPDSLSQSLEKVSAPLKQGTESAKGTFLIEAGWPEPGAPTSVRMRRLASALDGGQPGELKSALDKVHQNYPALRTSQDVSLMLDVLASQPRSLLLNEKSSVIPVTPGSYRLETALDMVSTHQSQANQIGFTKYLGTISPVKPEPVRAGQKPIVGNTPKTGQSSGRKLTPGGGGN